MFLNIVKKNNMKDVVLCVFVPCKQASQTNLNPNYGSILTVEWRLNKVCTEALCVLEGVCQETHQSSCRLETRTCFESHLVVMTQEFVRFMNNFTLSWTRCFSVKGTKFWCYSYPLIKALFKAGTLLPLTDDLKHRVRINRCSSTIIRSAFLHWLCLW